MVMAGFGTGDHNTIIYVLDLHSYSCLCLIPLKDFRKISIVRDEARIVSLWEIKYKEQAIIGLFLHKFNKFNFHIQLRPKKQKQKQTHTHELKSTQSNFKTS